MDEWTNAWTNVWTDGPMRGAFVETDGWFVVVRGEARNRVIHINSRMHVLLVEVL